MRYRGGETSTLSNHADIETTKNNAIEHFLYVESFRDEQKIGLNLVRRGQDVFGILPTGSGRETLIEGLNGVVAFWLFYGYRLIFFSYG